MNKYDKKTYEQDFPDHGDFNWKTVKLITPDEPYYNGHKIIGVVLHDGNFMVNGVLFLKNQYEIIDENPYKSKNINIINIEDEIDKILMKNFTNGDYKEARTQLLNLYNNIPQTYGIVRWFENKHDDIICINHEKAQEYVDKYNKLSGKEECYVDIDIWTPLKNI